MRRIAATLAVVGALLFSAGSAIATERVVSEPELETLDAPYVTVKNANVREQPDVQSSRVATLPKGSEITALAKVKHKNWYLVAREGEKLGYVFGDLLQEIGTDLAEQGVSTKPAQRRYKITLSDGSTHAVDGPEGMTRQQLIDTAEYYRTEREIEAANKRYKDYLADRKEVEPKGVSTKPAQRRYQVTLSDGTTHEIDGPEGATEAQIISAVETLRLEREMAASRKNFADYLADRKEVEPKEEDATLENPGLPNNPLFWRIFSWILLLAPAVVIRKYRRRPMNRGQAIGASAGIAFLCVCFFIFLAHELGINELMSGNLINAGPIAIASFISFWILRKKSVLGDESSLGMLDRIFKKIFGRY